MLKTLIILFLNLLTLTSFAQYGQEIQHEEATKKGTKRPNEQVEPVKETKAFDAAASRTDTHASQEKPHGRIIYLGRTAEAPHKLHKAPEEQEASDESLFIYDGYTSRRGSPAMLEIYCESCEKPVMSYQKDGPGNLLRCYLDRIHRPRDLKERQYGYFNERTAIALRCPYCSRVIGIPMIYRPENRPAYKMLRNRFYFKVTSQQNDHK
jgi:hypothetical protein